MGCYSALGPIVKAAVDKLKRDNPEFLKQLMNQKKDQKTNRDKV